MGKAICQNCGYIYQASRNGAVHLVVKCNKCYKKFPDEYIEKFVKYFKGLK